MLLSALFRFWHLFRKPSTFTRCRRTYRQASFGHHGGNEPVMNMLTNRVEITAQNHNYVPIFLHLDSSFQNSPAGFQSIPPMVICAFGAKDISRRWCKQKNLGVFVSLISISMTVALKACSSLISRPFLCNTIQRLHLVLTMRFMRSMHLRRL